MEKLKYFNIELDGIDKCGKDSIKPYLFYLEPGKYLCRSRGLISQIAFAKLYKRDFDWDAIDYVKNTIFVLLNVVEKDWKIRCKITDEPELPFTYNEMINAFQDAANEIYKRFNLKHFQILRFNTSLCSPYQIASDVITIVNQINKE